MTTMEDKKRKGNKKDLAPSRTEKRGIGQYILAFFLLLYTLFCALPVVLVFISAFSDETVSYTHLTLPTKA